MRVGLITTSYPRYSGDPAGSFVAGHASWLASRGHRVEIVCAGDPEQAHQQWQRGVTISPVWSPPGLFYRGGAPDALAARPQLAAGAARFSAALAISANRRSRRWDVLYAHWILPCAVAACLAPWRVPITAIAHSGDVHLARRLGLVAPLAALLASRQVRLVFVSAALRQIWLDHAWPPVVRRQIARSSTVTAMGVDVTRFRALHSRRQSGQITDCKDGAQPLTVLFLGRLVPIKGARFLIAAAPHLAAMLPVRVRIVIAGDGPEKTRLRSQAQSCGRGIEFVGQVAADMRDRLLAEADVVAIPSISVEGERSEGAPVTALEAMAAGVPVVTTRTGGLAELPADTLTRVAPGDAVALARAIAHLHRDRQARSQQIARAAAFAETRDWSAVGRALWQAALGHQGISHANSASR